jgi:2-polyprenyl-3-methyl-5-hydroxy-6-metoxy-1,4-benzoquinol methylase
MEAILDGPGPPGRLVAADVGAGTGISAQALADRGVRVIAVEPGDAMRRPATPHSRVTWVAGTVGATGLRSR